MEILRIKIEIGAVTEVKGEVNVKMISFTGECRGEYFHGKILSGGVDTQKLDENGNGTFSARYMLQGTDCEQNDCCVFIENNALVENGKVERTRSDIVTDSPVLSCLLKNHLYGTLRSDETGFYVCIHAET